MCELSNQTSKWRAISEQALYSQAAAQGVQHFQQSLQAHGGLAGLQFHNEAHAHASGQRQLGLG